MHTKKRVSHAPLNFLSHPRCNVSSCKISQMQQPFHKKEDRYQMSIQLHKHKQKRKICCIDNKKRRRQNQANAWIHFITSILQNIQPLMHILSDYENIDSELGVRHLLIIWIIDTLIVSSIPQVSQWQSLTTQNNIMTCDMIAKSKREEVQNVNVTNGFRDRYIININGCDLRP